MELDDNITVMWNQRVPVYNSWVLSELEWSRAGMSAVIL